jgi:hypothetical protein
MLMQGLRRLTVDAEKLDQKQGDPLIDLRPYSAVRRVKRVVEIEDPGSDVPKTSAQHLIGWQPERGRGNQGRHGNALVYAPTECSVVAARVERLATMS